ncbi:hypothetical protein [Rhodopseudomonas palustris]
MTKTSRLRRTARPSMSSGSIISGFIHGLTQIGSFGHPRPLANYPNAKSDDAIRRDWKRLGDDMRRGIDKVRDREKAKA